MLRFYFVIIVSIIPILYFVSKAHIMDKNPDAYTDTQRYEHALYACNVIQKRSFIDTDFYGQDNLPAEGGYIMYPNHQGRYDAVGIMLGHSSPCSIVIDKNRSKTFVLNEFVSVVRGKRLDKADLRGQVEIINEVAEEVKNGRRYILFPEGGYDEKTNNDVEAFMPGAFKAAIKAKCPIVPVALIDSYKPYGFNSLKRVRTQVHFLEPINYEEYKEMRSSEISDMVHDKIVKKINEVLTA